MSRYTEVTYAKLRDRWVRILKQELIREIQEVKATLKDIGVVFDDYISKHGYTATKNTKLYINHGFEYCILLEILNYFDKEHKFDEVYELKRVKSIGTVYAVFYQDSSNYTHGLVIFSKEDYALSCFSRLFTIGKQKDNVLYNTNAEYKKKYDNEIKLACEKALKIESNVYIRDIQYEDVKFLYESKRIKIVNPLKILI